MNEDGPWAGPIHALSRLRSLQRGFRVSDEAMIDALVDAYEILLTTLQRIPE